MINNREKGHRFERQIRTKLQSKFPGVKTSRSESRELDNKGVDFAHTAPFNFQCKSLSKRVNYDEILEKMSLLEGISVILHRLTEKKGNRFYVRGEYAILKMDDFLRLIDVL